MSLRVLISECLLGAPVRYDGGAKPSLAVERLAHCLRRRGGGRGGGPRLSRGLGRPCLSATAGGAARVAGRHG